jgi:ATP adenylyltransferase
MTPNERLWAPWRMEYVEGPKSTGGEGCIFCEKPAADASEDAGNLIVFRGDTCFVILNSFPYNNGHLMVVPYRHVDRLDGLDDAELAELGQLTARCVSVLDGAYGPDGYNVGINLGAAGGAGIAGHLHQHIVPRWRGDTNFMPVVADTRVLPEALSRSFDKIAGGFAGGASAG